MEILVVNNEMELSTHIFGHQIEIPKIYIKLDIPFILQNKDTISAK